MLNIECGSQVAFIKSNITVNFFFSENIMKTWVYKKKEDDVMKMATLVIPNFSPPHKKTNWQLSIKKASL